MKIILIRIISGAADHDKPNVHEASIKRHALPRNASMNIKTMLSDIRNLFH